MGAAVVLPYQTVPDTSATLFTTAQGLYQVWTVIAGNNPGTSIPGGQMDATDVELPIVFDRYTVGRS